MQKISGKTIILTRGDTMRIKLTIKKANGEDYIPSEGDAIRFALNIPLSQVLFTQELVYPPINIGFLRSEKIVNNNKYRVRIRFNRNKKITVDRYIQKGDSMDPFDDSFNEKIMKYQKYEPSLALNSMNHILLL